MVDYQFVYDSMGKGEDVFFELFERLYAAPLDDKKQREVFCEFMFLAISNNLSSAVRKMVREHNPMTLKELNLCVCNNEHTFLTFAVQNADKFKIDEDTPVHALLDSGLDVNKENSNGMFPLSIAAKQSNAPLVQFLLTKGAMIHIDTGDGSPAAIARHFADPNVLYFMENAESAQAHP